MSAEETGGQKAVSALPGQLPLTTSVVQAPQATQPAQEQQLPPTTSVVQAPQATQPAQEQQLPPTTSVVQTPQATQPAQEQQLPPTTSVVQASQATQPAQEQQSSAGVVAASAPPLEAPPEYSEVVRQSQGTAPVQQGMVPVQYVQQPGQQGMVPVQYVQQPGQQGLQQPVFMYVTQQPPGPGGGTLQPPSQQVPYMVQAPMQPYMARPRPPYSGPHDFQNLAMIVAIICAILNLTSLACGIAAIFFASSSQNLKFQGNYPAAKGFSNKALFMIVLTIVWTLSWAGVISGWSLVSYYYPAA